MERRPTRVTWLGHAAVEIVTASGTTLLIDPWLTNPKGVRVSEDIDRCDVVLVTHGHQDHIGDAVAIAQRTDAAWPCLPEMAGWVNSRVGRDCALPFNIGGSIEVADVTITATPAIHSAGDSILESGGFESPAVPPMGFVIETSDGVRIYHSGDTALFGDMRLLARRGIDLALVPIGGRFTMDPEDAAEAVALLGARAVIPIHHGTIPLLTGTPAELRSAMASRQLGGIEMHDLNPGESVSIHASSEGR